MIFAADSAGGAGAGAGADADAGAGAGIDAGAGVDADAGADADGSMINVELGSSKSIDIGANRGRDHHQQHFGRGGGTGDAKIGSGGNAVVDGAKSINGSANGGVPKDSNSSSNSSNTKHQTKISSANKQDQHDEPASYSYDSANYQNKSYATTASDSINSYNQSGSAATSNNFNFYDKGYYPLSTIQIFQLYIKFKQGVSVEKWLQENENSLRDLDVDIRRFVTYGLLQGILYRIYAYPMLVEYNSKWLTKCKVYYLEKNDNTGLGLNEKFFSNQNENENSELVEKEIYRIVKDQKFMDMFAQLRYIQPLSLEEIEKRNFHLVEFKTNIFPKPGSNADLGNNNSKMKLNGRGNHYSSYDNYGYGGGSNNTNYNTDARNHPGGNSNSNSNANAQNKISLQKFKNPKYIKLIKGASDNKYYSLISVLTMKKEYLDKIKHFDLICTEFDASKKEVELLLRNFWKYHVVQR